MAVGDRIIRVYDGKLGVIERESDYDWLWVRFDDGILAPVHFNHLRLLEIVLTA